MIVKTKFGKNHSLLFRYMWHWSSSLMLSYELMLNRILNTYNGQMNKIGKW